MNATVRLDKSLRGLGSWAVVTGASSGIGEAFARRLASAGLHVVMVACRAEVMKRIAAEIESEFGVEVQIVALDLSKEESGDFLFERVKDQEVGLIVHSAGSGVPGAFVNSELEKERSLLNLNCLAPMVLTRLFLPLMARRKRGGVVFVSSLMGVQGVPYMAHYSAMKAYLINLAEGLHEECREEGIKVLALAPGATDTPGKDLFPVDYDQLPIKWRKAEEVVEKGLRGLIEGASLEIPGVENQIGGCLGSGLWTRNFVRRLMARLAKKALGQVLGK